jgi:Lrp/AsnC family transcriptional regulator for asnA, asnC and gidA
MDKVDFEILRELLKDSRVPFSRIAEKLNLAPDTVCRRYEKMKKSGVITTNYVSFDPAKLGYKAIIFLLIKIAPNHGRKEAVNIVRDIPGVFAVIEILGEFNLFVNVLVKSLKEFASVVSKISELPTVERVEFSLSEDFTLLKPEADVYSPIIE